MFLMMRRQRLHLSAGDFGLIFDPSHRRFSSWDFHHRDASIDWADQCAQIASNAIIFANFGNVFVWNTTRSQIKPKRIGIQEVNALVRTIFACDITEIASNACIVIDSCNLPKIQIKLFPCCHIGDCASAEIMDAAHFLFVKI